jgi:sugar phosphate isomerase/epimerase
MIFVSSACVTGSGIEDSLRTLHKNGFTCIECSGGARYEADYEDVLLRLKKELGLQLLCHNYFPVPQVPFVLNLSSGSDEIYQRSIDHLKRALDLSRNIGADKFAFHAGFFIDILVREIGKDIRCQDVADPVSSTARFIDAYKILNANAAGVKLYVENNALSKSNKERFGRNPFMLLNTQDILDLKRAIAFNLLLDVGHLKVSCASLGLNLEKELAALMPTTDYIHISDNDGTADQNRRLSRDSELWRALKGFDLKGKTVTLEIYEGLDALRESYDLLSEAVKC